MVWTSKDKTVFPKTLADLVSMLDYYEQSNCQIIIVVIFNHRDLSCMPYENTT